MLKRTVVTIFVRHRSECQHEKKAFTRVCDCPKWLRYSGDACLCGYSHKGRQHRLSADTRTWRVAEEKREELQKRLDAGATTSAPQTTARTIANEVETFIAAKRGMRLSNATLRKLRYQVTLLEQFMSRRSIFFSSEIRPHDVVEFRQSWTWKSGVTLQKAQQNIRGFLRRCNPPNLKSLLDVMQPIKLSKTDITRLKPRPFSEDELKRLLAQVPKTFPDKEKQARMTALVHCQVSTGLAIRDTVQLERTNIKDGWLRIERQKTNKPVVQRLDPTLCAELLSRLAKWQGTLLYP